jgi:hypothetical protein
VHRTGAVAVVKVSSLAEQLFFSTAQVLATDGANGWVGTAFFHAAETDKGQVDLLVTNKHVLAGATRVELRFIAAADDGPMLGTSVPFTYANFGTGLWRGHPDPRVDVAVMPIRPALDQLSKAGKRLFYRQVPPQMMLKDEDTEELDALESVVFVGYPSGIYDTVNLTPVARQGLTATPVMIDYQGLPAFLIDASVFPGSSGSPVYKFDRGIKINKSGETLFGATSALLLGVLAAVHVRTVDGRVTEIETALEVTFDEPVDLGIVFRARAITECVDALLAEAGLVRSMASPDLQKADPDRPPSEAEERLEDHG